MAGTVLLVGRILFGMLFVFNGYNHFANLGMMTQYTASQGVPLPQLAVIVTGLMLLFGGLSMLLGWQVRAGALVLVAFLVPVAFMMHRFWGLSDPGMAQMQMGHFYKNIALAGAALMIYALASFAPARWPYSVRGSASAPMA